LNVADVDWVAQPFRAAVARWCMPEGMRCETRDTDVKARN
jgi:hypothetical protein